MMRRLPASGIWRWSPRRENRMRKVLDAITTGFEQAARSVWSLTVA
jgi:hypothetical protein